MLLVCSLINTNFGFATATLCILRHHEIWCGNTLSIIRFFCLTLCRTTNMLLVTYSLPVWEIYMAIINDH
jgi:hypothetical protein